MPRKVGRTRKYRTARRGAGILDIFNPIKNLVGKVFSMHRAAQD